MGKENELLMLMNSIIMLENQSKSSFISEKEKRSLIGMRITKMETLRRDLKKEIMDANNSLRFNPENLES